MTDRDRLIEITEKSFAEQYEKRGLLTAPHTVDDLLANGVFILPEDLRGTDDFSISAFIEAMQMYKEKDRYIKPPCKVGDKVWLINNPREYEVLNFHFTGQILWATLILIEEPTIMREINTDHFGKTVFLTKEEAEAKLKELGK